MKKTVMLISVLLFLLTCTAWIMADEVDFPGSNQSRVTKGFELNQYDFLLDASLAQKLKKTNFFFGLTEDLEQFDLPGFSGGAFFKLGKFNPGLVISYQGSQNCLKEDAGENTVSSYLTYDALSGTYVTVEKSLNIAPEKEVMHNLKFHFLSELSDLPLNFAVQGHWYHHMTSGSSETNTDQYNNTSAPDPANYTARTASSDSEWKAHIVGGGPYLNNRLAFDLEAGLDLGQFLSLIKVGINLANLGTATNNYYISNSRIYNAGGDVDDTVLDSETSTSWEGAFSVNTFGTIYDNINISQSSAAAVAGSTRGLSELQPALDLSLDAINTLTVMENLDVPISAGFNMTIPNSDLDLTKTTKTVSYNDNILSGGMPLESGQTITEDRAVLDKYREFGFYAESGLLKSIQLKDKGMLYAGGLLGYNFSRKNIAVSKTQTVETKIDGNNDGLYDTLGVDTHSITKRSNYEVEDLWTNNSINLSLPLAATFRPLKNLSFYAGIEPGLTVSFESHEGVVKGDAALPYVEYKDLLDPTNNDIYIANGSNNSNRPDKSLECDYSFFVESNFGFNLSVTEDFSIDAIANFSGRMNFDSFEVLARYSLPNKAGNASMNSKTDNELDFDSVNPDLE